jgi:hypothetical protein
MKGEAGRAKCGAVEKAQEKSLESKVAAPRAVIGAIWGFFHTGAGFL